MAYARKRASMAAAPLLFAGLLPAIQALSAGGPPAAPAAPGGISYYRQVRPLFQARCQGCHQPAKISGAYLMTDFPKLLAGGASGKPAIVPRQPRASHILDLITPVNGKAKMPMAAKPLAPGEIELVRRWIAEGATDDSARFERVRYDMEHPPVYSRPPVISSLDYSPNGQMIAVTGFNEVLLLSADGTQRLGRLVGASERVQSVRFSPDGKLLAVTAGQPARRGEIQIWDVEQKKLVRSVPMTADTVYGVSWSPDGKKIAFGCADNTVRAIDATSGEQVLQQGSHSDWVLGTAWSPDGSHLISASRDFTAKLTEVATQRFVDNLTSITPGALKGGFEAVVRHPKRDEVVLGGSDGAPKIFRIYRPSARQIGDNANLIKELPALKGRIYGLAVSPDGTRIAAGSSLDGSGEVAVYHYDAAVPNPEISRVAIPESAIYAVAFRPDGKAVAAAGTDGQVRILDADTGKLLNRFAAAPVQAPAKAASTAKTVVAPRPEEPLEPEKLPAGAKVYGLDVQPKTIRLSGPFDAVQILVTARLQSGETFDATRLVQAHVSAPAAMISRSGLVQPRSNGQATLKLALAGKTASVPVFVGGLQGAYHVDYIREVQPLLGKLGCNQGTCHGAAKGKNGFKLSLRGYDPIFDVRALTDDHACRRMNFASAADSLMLLKPAAAVPHAGGQLFHPGEPSYELLRSWIADGAKLNLASPRVTSIQLLPEKPVLQRADSSQQMRVVATYSDGRVRDVTREAFVDSGNTEVATANRSGLLTASRRGEAPILARFEGSYAATTLTVMGDRTGFAWKQPPTYGKLDELVAAKWKRMKIQPSELCTDAEFIRRVTLDLTGLPPTSEDVKAFLADPTESRSKREALVDRLIGSKAYVEYWTNKWADLLEVNRKFLGVEGAVAYRKWIRDQVEQNTPYDQFARKILTARGSNRENPAASYYKVLREAPSIMENTTHLFLGVRFNCNKCHDHPFERWTQDQYYQLSAYFAQVGLSKDPASGNQQIGGTAVEGAKPLYEIVADTGQGEIKHERTGQVTAPKFPFPCKFEAPEKATRRDQLAAWLTSPDNPYFARSYVNRLWGYMFGVGIIEPIDDIRAGNPPTNPELLDYLTREFVSSGFNARHMLQMICKSRAYQLSLASNKWNVEDRTNYSHASARRLPAEVLYDTIYAVTGSTSHIPGVPPGTRAAELPDSGVEIPGGFLGTFGRPARESACECERSNGVQLGPVLALISGATVSDAISDSGNVLAKLTAAEKEDTKLVNEVFLRILNRPAKDTEVRAFLEIVREIDGDHQKLVDALKKREEEVRGLRVRQEQERVDTIAATRAELDSYQKEAAPVRAEQERQRQERIARAQSDLKAYQAALPQHLEAWEKAQSRNVRWTVLTPETLAAPAGTMLAKQADGSVLASGKQTKGTYTFAARTELQGIRAIRLEVLPDRGFKSDGPGRAPDGNFVLTEFDVTAAPAGNPKAAASVGLADAKADFAQNGFDIGLAINGDTANGAKGWAVSPSFGIPHWATFQTKAPVGTAGGTLLTFSLHHQFGKGEYGLGRFRISVATEEKPVGLSLADDLKAILDTPREQRTAQQTALLTKYFASVDPGMREKRAAVAEAGRPLPTDEKLKALEERLAYVSRPVPEDGRLAQLRKDLDASTKQLTDKRLTAVQDLAWALINSPAFLFNH